MSFRLVAAAWETEIKSPGCKLVLMGLASYANDEGECWPRQETLAERTCQTSRSVRSHLEWLEANGYIQREHRNTTAGRRSDFYVITIKQSQPEKISACATGKKRQSQPEKISACSIQESVINNTPSVKNSALDIYQAYPRKVGKLAALKAIEKALKASDLQTIMASVQRFAAQVKAERTEERFIPHPSTWFNQGRWMDEQKPAQEQEQEDWGTFGHPRTWPSSWIKHPTENRPMRPGEIQ